MADKQNQAKKFEAAARDAGCSENVDVFDEALRKIASSPPPDKASVKKQKTDEPAK